jgi:hypothetical protein
MSAMIAVTAARLRPDGFVEVDVSCTGQASHKYQIHVAVWQSVQKQKADAGEAPRFDATGEEQRFTGIILGAKRNPGTVALGSAKWRAALQQVAPTVEPTGSFPFRDGSITVEASR